AAGRGWVTAARRSRPEILLSTALAAVAAGLLVVTGVPLAIRFGLTVALGTATSAALGLWVAPRLLARGESAPPRRVQPGTGSSADPVPLRTAVPPPAGGSPDDGTDGPRIATADDAPTSSALNAAPVRRRLPAAAGAAGALLLVGVALGVATTNDAVSGTATLGPRDSTERRAAEAVQRSAGHAGGLRVAVTGRVRSPGALQWMQAVGTRTAESFRSAVPGPNLGEIVDGEAVQTAAQVRRRLQAVPADVLGAVLGRERAELTFALSPAAVGDPTAAVDRARSMLGGTPPGTQARLVGTVALAAASDDAMRISRVWLPAATLLAVLGVLLLTGLAARRAVVVVVPGILGATSAVLTARATGSPLTPLSLSLVPLGVVLGTQFALMIDGEARRRRSFDGTVAIPAVRRTVVASSIVLLASAALLQPGRVELLGQFGVLLAVETIVCAAAALWLVPRLMASRERRAAPDDRGRTALLGKVLPGDVA
ncbi:hypothetical protein AB0L40_16225, partial [Patulibacter sp. NPDC049589]|uniref:hypothetical protein n=1 Tax=Patulibacter sp. NPDC049589 TaxID=3154731 RepID=UPI00341CAC22